MNNNKTSTKGDLYVEDINKGDIFLERIYGRLHPFQAITQPELKENKWSWKARSLKEDREVDFLVHKDFPHYAPELYKDDHLIR